MTMADTLYFEHTKTGKRFRIVSLDQRTGKIVLEGENSRFVDQYDKDRFKAMGYRLVRESTEDAEQ